MKKIIIIIALMTSVVSASFAQIPIRVGVYVIRQSDTIYIRPNMYRDASYVWNEIKSTHPLWLRVDSVLKITGGSLWWEGTTGGMPTTGAGTRMMYVPVYGSLCGGIATATAMDVVGLGTFSWGYNNTSLGNYLGVVGNTNYIDSEVSSSFVFGSRNTYASIGRVNYSLLGGYYDTINTASYCSVTGSGNYTASTNTFIHSYGSRIPIDSAESCAILGGSDNVNNARSSVILGGHDNTLNHADSNVVLMNRQIIRNGWGKDLTQWQLRSGTVVTKIDTSGRAFFNKSVSVTHDSSSANSSKTLLNLNITTSGTAAAGLGGGLMFNIEKNTGSLIAAGRIRTSLLHANGGSVMSFWTNTGATATLTEVMRIDTSQILMIGYTSPVTSSSWKLQCNSGGYFAASVYALGTVTGITSVQTAKLYPASSLDLNIGTFNNAGGKYINFRTNAGAGTIFASASSTGKWRFNTTTAADTVEILNVNGGYRISGRQINIPTGTTASPTLIAVTGVTSVSTFTTLRIEGNGGAIDITANPQIVDGYDGQIIEIWCEDDVNTVKFDDGTGLQLAGGASFTLGLGDMLKVRYFADVDLWREVGRSDN